MEKIYPKVLIIGQTFHKNSGGGITISNLFQGWPKEKLAVVSNVYLSSFLDTSVCRQYYQMGYNGKLHPFPINLFLPKIKCGIIVNNNVNNNAAQAENAFLGKYKKIYKILSRLLRVLGIYNIIYRLKITPEFKEWVTEYNPDIIYSQLSSLELIRFVSDVHDLLNKPVGLHIMDDWPNAMDENEMFFTYWKKVTDMEFRKLINKSSVLMSICESMSEEYKIRYSREFTAFHNPVEIANWLPYSKNDWQIKDKFTILYAGRIGRGIRDSIYDIAQAVNNFSKTHKNIVFEILTFDSFEVKNLVKSNNNVKYLTPLEYFELPKKFSSVDLLLLPEDFDEASIEFLKYSLQTKVPEYMISGTPILVYADERTALAKYASKEGWAYIVSKNDETLLTNAFMELYSNISLRRELAEKAMKVAIQYEDAKVVRENFRKNLIIK